MKTLLIFGVTLLAAAGLSSCKSKDAVKPAENVLSAYTTDGTLVNEVLTGSAFEFGVVFSASVAGKLTQVGGRMPEAGTYRVTVWDNASKQVLRQKIVEQTTPDRLTLNDVEPLLLTPNTRYVISVNSQAAGANRKYHKFAKTDGGDLFPVVKGSILVESSTYGTGATAVFPANTSVAKTRLYGFPDFTFIPD